MKKIVALILCCCTVLSVAALTSCGAPQTSLDVSALSAEYSRELEGTTLKVYNWGEYISDGSDGSLDVN